MDLPLRFITCGSVDDGKSSLIGRLLLESRQIFDDQLQSVQQDSIRFGTQGSNADLALLVDGLQAEREQGITIDVAYRFFATPARKFIAADTPGHEQYTRNMATAASTAQLAVLLVDARKGVLIQTRRHARIVAMLGVRHVVLAINKMDLVEWDEQAFRRIESDFRQFAVALGFVTIEAIAMSALLGDNVVSASRHMPWYRGPCLLEHLEGIVLQAAAPEAQFHMPVQYVNRPSSEFRGYCGRVASGSVAPGDRVRIWPGGATSRIKSIVVHQDTLERAIEGDSVTLVLEDDVDASRGDVVSAVDAALPVSDQFQAHMIWMAEQPLVAGRSYLLMLHTQLAHATVTAIRYQIDANSGAHLAARQLQLNEMGVVNVSLDRKCLFDAYQVNRRLGAFILIDRLSNATTGAGMIDFPLRRADNIHWQTLSIDRQRRSPMKSQRPICIWFTGLSGSGKSTIANLLEQRLHAQGRHTFLLDGDNVRHGLNRDLGFIEADRAENIRRVAEVARLMVDAGLIVIVSLISPYRSDRQHARSLFDGGAFVEVFVDTPVEECERRDPKGLYAKVRAGNLKNFTGVDSRYEAPEMPEVRLNTLSRSPDDCIEHLMLALVPRITDPGE